MKSTPTKLGLLMALNLVSSATGWAEAGAPQLSPADRAEILQTLGAKLSANYVFPDVAAKVIKVLPARVASYDKGLDPAAFSALLSRDLRDTANDRHFRVFPDPGFREPETAGGNPSPQELEQQRAEVASMAYGVETVQRLPGNVAYVELRGFGPTELVAQAYASTMALVAGSDALILDLRRNGGGSPSSVALWMSYFFALGDERHLNDIYTRSTDQTQQYWTSTGAGVAERYVKPVYVLTSPRTFSGGEECAYDFQTQKRATLIGETTGGGANAGDRFALGHGLVVNIPTARAINPVTHTNWEHVGVKPDVEVPAAEAQKTAYVTILRKQLAVVTDPHDREELAQLLALAEKGESPVPVYKMRH